MKTTITLLIALLIVTIQLVATNYVYNAFNTLVLISENSTTIYDDDSAFTLIAIESMPSNQTSLYAQCTNPITYSIKQTKITQSSTQQDVQAYNLGYMYYSYSNSIYYESIVQIDISYSSFSVSFDISTQDTVLDLIKSNSRFNLSYLQGYSFIKSNTKVYNILPRDILRSFIQNQKGQANSQTRYITSTRGYSSNLVSYGPQSAYQHSNQALDRLDIVNNGCSNGARVEY